MPGCQHCKGCPVYKKQNPILGGLASYGCAYCGCHAYKHY